MDVWFDGESMKAAKAEKYLVMTLRASGLTADRSKQRVTTDKQEMGNLTRFPWWSAALAPRQMGPAFNVTVREEYIYSFAFVPWDQGTGMEDRRGTEAEMKAMPRTNMHVNDTTRRKLQTIIPMGGASVDRG